MNYYNENLEHSILGSIITDPDYLPDVMAILTDPAMFLEPINRTIFEVIRTKYDSGESIDLVTLAQSPILRPHIAYIANLTTMVGTGANSITHSRLLVERDTRNKLLGLATQLISKAQNDADVCDTLGWVQTQLDVASGAIAGADTPKPLREVIAESLNEAEQRAIARTKGEAVGIPTGLTDLDRSTGGWRGGQLIIVAGRPAMGKSAVMMHFAKSAAAAGVPVVLFSLEMQGRELGDRLLLGGAKVNGGGYKVGNIISEEWRELERANGALSKLPIYISDRSLISMQKIRAHCGQMKAKGKCGMVIVDYLGLLDTEGKSKHFSREREVAEITRQAKTLANELDVPIILLSQLNRESEKRADKMPMLSDLRDSGSIEQDANTVIFVHRPYYYDRTAQIEVAGQGLVDAHGLGVLKIAKQRNGQTGVVFFSHSDDLNRIGDYCEQLL